MAQALSPLGMFNKDNFKGSSQPHFRDEFNDIKKFVDKYLTGFMDDWGKGVFDNVL